MARSKKIEEKPKDSGSLQISVEDFVRTRNSVSNASFPFQFTFVATWPIYLLRTHITTVSHYANTPTPFSISYIPNTTMSTPQKCYMTRDGRAEALYAVDLLALPCQNVCDIAYKLVRNIMYGAANPEQSQLIITPQVVTGLATLQSAVSDLSRAYIAHTDTVIGRGNASSLEQLNISNPLAGENALFGQRGPTPAPTTELAAEGKKRKRAPHDKNAPKRALTPFFLYLQTARSTIAGEMGAGKTAKEVQDEGGKRWREMSEDDKKEWQDKYAVNFARYKEQMKSYKAGQGIPEISDAKAKEIFETTKSAGKLPSPPDLDPGHAEEEDDSDASDSSEEESPEPVKAPPPKRNKTTKAAAKQTPVKEVEPVVVERSSKSPEKKKKGSRKKDTKAAEDVVGSKKDVVAEPTSSPPNPITQEKPKKAKGKKRKSEAPGA